MSMLQTAAVWLAGRRKTYVTMSVTYARGSQSVSLSATPGRSTTVTNPDGVEVKISDRDWILTSADLILGDSLTTPQIGDVIEETADGQVYTWTVLPPDGDKEWRYCDSHRHSLRVHCKLTGVADAA